MPKSPQALQVLPPAATQALRALGENLAIARVRRHESQRAWAKRLGVSVPTLIRLERGDPGVGAGIYATALWLMGRVSALPDLAAPGDDRGALESDVREAVQRRAVRSAASTEARLGRGKAKYGSDAAVAEAPPQPWGSAAKASQPSASQPKVSEPRPRGSTTDRKADK
jgi:transcriptional regulator with XRE-family HTH domain